MWAENRFFGCRFVRRSGCMSILSAGVLVLALASCSGVTRPGLTENDSDVLEARQMLVDANAELMPSRNLNNDQQLESFTRVFNVIRPAAVRVCHLIGGKKLRGN